MTSPCYSVIPKPGLRVDQTARRLEQRASPVQLDIQTSLPFVMCVEEIE